MPDQCAEAKPLPWRLEDPAGVQRQSLCSVKGETLPRLCIRSVRISAPYFQENKEIILLCRSFRTPIIKNSVHRFAEVMVIFVLKKTQKIE